MARLWDSSRLTSGKGYSLEALTNELYKRKIPMKEKFGRHKTLKGGGQGKVVEVPDVLTLHRMPEYRSDWIEYSAFDAEGTWHIYQALSEKLREMPWKKVRVYTRNDIYSHLIHTCTCKSS
jgi:hypothetical protein